MLLDVRNLSVSLTTPDGSLPIVDGLSLAIAPGETVAIVGESGCGKSATALAIAGLLASPLERTGGEVLFDGQPLPVRSSDDSQTRFWNGISMIFQEPMTTLNPTMSIRDQIAEPLRVHDRVSRRAAHAEAVRLLERVGVRSARERSRAFPHQFSGGMRQRVVIAMALAARPRLLIADEPTTALDVTVQKRILTLLAELRREFELSILLISHDLPVVAEFADRATVMYAGRAVESGPVGALFAAPSHPYTRALLRSAPQVSAPRGASRRLPTISGEVPRPHARPDGCAFHPRCDVADDDTRCRKDVPQPTSSGDRSCACWNPLESGAIVRPA